MSQRGSVNIDWVKPSFQQTILKEGVTLEEAIENIDVAGRLCCVQQLRVSGYCCCSDPSDYKMVLDELKK